jgi:hypothetical protein
MPFDSTLIPNGDEQHRQLISTLIKELFLDQRRVFTKWARITNQSAQLDSGYIAQHLISLLTGIRGIRRRGKGLDLSDGSEVKCANSVDGVDVPRWNHDFRRPGKVNEWLQAPRIYYVLFDTTENDKVRVRVWVVNPTLDEAYQTVIQRWHSQRSSGNFQIHPPVGRDDNIGTNLCGNLELPLMLAATENDDGTVHVNSLDLSSPRVCRLIERD